MHIPSHRPRVIQFFGLLLAGLLCATAFGDEPQWTQLSERWYIFEIADSKAGWMRETVESDNDQFRTITETRMRFGRADVEAGVQITTEFIETADGKAISMSSNQTMSSQSIKTSFVFTEDGVKLTTSQGGRSTTSDLPGPAGEWLTPNALQQFLKQRHEARPKQFTYRAIDPTSGLEPVSATTSFTREDTFQLGDRAIPVTVWTSRTSVLPVDAIEMYSADDVLVYWEATTGMGKMVMRLSDRKAAVANDGGPPPELLVSAFSRSDRPLDQARHATQVRYILTATNGDLIKLPTAGAQRATNTTESTATLLVDIEDNIAATEAELDSNDFRAASALIDSDDPLVRKLAQRALRGAGDDDDMKRAEKIRAFVFKHINDKGYETAFASASETARTRTGDCSEHAVLLAAMLRAAEIPSRVATGLVYVGENNGQGIFGWHMWTQALLDGRWVDFDATLPTRYTTGHILTSTSSFSDASSNNELNSLIALMGNIEIMVHDFDAR